MPIRWLTAVAVTAVLGAACGSGESEEPEGTMDGRVHVTIDRSVIAGDDAFAVIEPVWWTANIYEGPKVYEASLAPFTRPQRLLFAVHWYRAEVNNGGHDQFYFNSTGIVWRDALAGFELLGLVEFAAVLRESAQRLGGEPSLDRGARQEALERIEPDFSDIDDRFYELEKSVDLDARMIEFMRKRPEDFLFDGLVAMPAPGDG